MDPGELREEVLLAPLLYRVPSLLQIQERHRGGWRSSSQARAEAVIQNAMCSGAMPQVTSPTVRGTWRHSCSRTGVRARHPIGALGRDGMSSHQTAAAQRLRLPVGPSQVDGSGMLSCRGSRGATRRCRCRASAVRLRVLDYGKSRRYIRRV